MKRTITSISALALVITLVQPAAAQDAFNPDTIEIKEGTGAFQVAEVGSVFHSSYMVANGRNSDDQWACESTQDPECASSKISWVRGEAVLPVCDDKQSENCVVSLEIAKSGEELQPAKFIRNTIGETFPEHKPSGFIAQATPSLWDAPNAPSKSGSTTYSVQVRITQDREFNQQKFRAYSFFASVVPYREVTGDYKAPTQKTIYGDPVRGTRARTFSGGGVGPGCAWTEDGKCGVMQDFADGTRIRLVVRIPSTLGGWYEGRIKDPSISVAKYSNTNNQVSVEAEAVSVQRMLYVAPDTKALTAKEKSYVSLGFAGSWDRFTVWRNAWDPGTFEYLNYFKTKAKDTAVGQNTFWSFSSSAGQANGSTCLGDTSKVLGVVSTNAMVYDGGVPKFSRGFLNYKVAGLHYEADGTTEVLGSYDLVMRSDVARCLYGFNKAPVSATITIAGEGDKTIATTVVGEKNGWLKLAAYGFTFSEKTIRVKITQPKRTTITCVTTSKPTKTKKVTAVNPKCPTGYKKR